MDLSLFLNNIQFLSIELIVAAFFVALISFWLERKIFFKLFEKVTKTDFAILLFIIILFSLLCVLKGFNFKSFIPSDQEWEILHQAKELLAGNEVFYHLRYGLVYPLFLSLTFFLFGINPLVASVLNFILSVLSIFLVFLLSQAIFRKKKISLISSFLYAFCPLVFVFTSFRMGFPALLSFFLLLITLVGVLFFQYHKINLFVLLITLVALIGQIKPEYFILIFPIILAFLFFKEYKRIPFNEVVVVILFFLLFSIPYFVQNYRFKQIFNSNWCGMPTQVFYNMEEHFYSVPFANQIDPIIRNLSNERFSISYLVYDLPNFVKFWSTNSFNVIFVFTCLGFLMALKKHKKEALFLFSLFSFLSALYLADCAFFETRYAITTYGLIVSLASFGIYTCSEKISKIIDKNNLFLKKIILTIIFLLISGSWYFNSYEPLILNGLYGDYFWDEVRIFDDYSVIKNILKDISKDNSIFIVVHPNEERILKILGYKAYSLINLMAPTEGALPEKKLSKEKIETLLSSEGGNYFIHSASCEMLPSLQSSCDFMKENYNFDVMKSSAEDQCTLYSFKEF